jgi:xylose isomerase
VPVEPLPSFACRLNSMGTRPGPAGWPDGGPRTTDLIRRLGQAEGITAVELNFPQHVTGHEIAELAEVAAEVDLPVTSVNLRFPDDPFLNGTLSNPDPEVRDQAVAMVLDAAATGQQLGADKVTMWLDKDGWDYPFQVDHAKAFEDLVEGLERIVEGAPGTRFSIEYKPSEPRAFSQLGNYGTTMLAVDAVGADNLGVRLDFCHVLMARESPGQVAALATARGKLFGIDFNDGYGQQDDGLMVGSVRIVETLEFLWYLRRGPFDGVVYFDTFPIREDPVEEASENVRRFAVMWKAAGRLNESDMAKLMQEKDAMGSQRVVFDAIWSP